ncbi:MAG: hypothetical protein ACOC2W_02420 [bacterium]
MVSKNIKKDFLYQFIPNKYLYLTKIDKIEFDGVNLKTSYIINIIHELIMKFYINKHELIERETKFNMWSTLLREKYGVKYNYYIKYLIEIGFIKMVSDYFKNKKSRTYALSTKYLYNITRCKVNDKILLKKHTQEYLKKTFLNYTNSPIDLDIRKKMVDNLYKIDIDVEGAITFLNDLKNDNKICYNKYQRNLISIENLGIRNIFFKFDEYGRMHTNFTILKKDIRRRFITIDGLPTYEIDIKNSQPFFLALLMKDTLDLSEIIKSDINRYIDLVKNGLIYEEIIEKCGVKDRNEAKILMYRVLFGKNGNKKKENILFKKEFPSVYKFINDYKQKTKDYKILSHKLQLKESEFIFGKVVNHLLSSYPDMVFYTIHDSIVVPIKYKDGAQKIFDFYLRSLLTL